ncbi:MAG: type 2 isopentenyl-diphosphate Delta-isomerase [Ignavibacteriaceae bacterium]
MNEETVKRKKEHIELCLTDKVAFRQKTNGFEKYDFIHFAPTEVEMDKIDLTVKFFSKKIDYPVLISCMTGGTEDADNINLKLASAAESLRIPLGLGSLRYALETNKFDDILTRIRDAAPSVPLLGNIGAAQILDEKVITRLEEFIKLADLDLFVVHLNPLQELMQKEGEPNFKGLMKALRNLVKELSVPVIIKEVGSGISRGAAEELLYNGAKGIDVAGAGGTSWAGVEILRSQSQSDENAVSFWDWGLPTSYCIRKISRLKKDYKFSLIASGGISNEFEIAKALALGADLTASARPVLKALFNGGVPGVFTMIHNQFQGVKKIMFLTGSSSLKELNRSKLILRKNLC